jgi:hypothetical protein
MNKKIEVAVGKINEAVGSMKANAQDAPVRNDGIQQQQLGKNQHKSSVPTNGQ